MTIGIIAAVWVVGLLIAWAFFMERTNEAIDTMTRATMEICLFCSKEKGTIRMVSGRYACAGCFEKADAARRELFGDVQLKATKVRRRKGRLSYTKVTLAAVALLLSPIAAHGQDAHDWHREHDRDRDAPTITIIPTDDPDSEALKRENRYRACLAAAGKWNAEVGACNEKTFR